MLAGYGTVFNIRLWQFPPFILKIWPLSSPSPISLPHHLPILPQFSLQPLWFTTLVAHRKLFKTNFGTPLQTQWIRVSWGEFQESNFLNSLCDLGYAVQLRYGNHCLTLSHLVNRGTRYPECILPPPRSLPYSLIHCSFVHFFNKLPLEAYGI